jgi:hypothetical protein
LRFLSHPPTTSNFTISGITENVLVSVFDLQGKEVMKTTATELDLSRQPNGVYLVKIIVNNAVWTGKVVRE